VSINTVFLTKVSKFDNPSVGYKKYRAGCSKLLRSVAWFTFVDCKRDANVRKWCIWEKGDTWEWHEKRELRSWRY